MGEKTTLEPDVHEIIQLAWDDKASFNDIEAQTGLKEKQVKRIMRDNMKPSSFRMWRKRVYGRDMKHAIHSPLENKEKRERNKAPHADQIDLKNLTDENGDFIS